MVTELHGWLTLGVETFKIRKTNINSFPSVETFHGVRTVIKWRNVDENKDKIKINRSRSSIPTSSSEMMYFDMGIPGTSCRKCIMETIDW